MNLPGIGSASGQRNFRKHNAHKPGDGHYDPADRGAECKNGAGDFDLCLHHGVRQDCVGRGISEELKTTGRQRNFTWGYPGRRSEIFQRRQIL